MDVLVFLKTRFWDFLLCAAASSSLVFTLCSAFHATWQFQSMPAVIVVACALLTAYLVGVSASMRTLAVGSAVLAVVFVVALVVCARMSNVASVLDDVEGNYLIFALVLFFATVLVFALSRRKPTLLVLMVVGLVSCALVEYLYWHAHVVAFLLFAASVGGLYVYRNYQRSLVSSASDALAFTSSTLVGLGITALALALAAGVFAAFIAPLEPPNAILKLVTVHKRVEQIDVTGTGAAVDVQNDQILSINTNGQVQNGAIDDQQQDASDNDDRTKDENRQDEENAGSALAIDDTLDPVPANVLALEMPPWAVAVLPLAVLLVLLVPLAVKKLLRRRRFSALMALPPAQRVGGFYRFFMGRFGRLGLGMPAGATVCGYARNFSDAFVQFERGAGDEGDDGGGSAFETLTDVFARTAYGAAEPTEAECSLFESYYRSFYRRARRYTGRLRYVRLFFLV